MEERDFSHSAGGPDWCHAPTYKIGCESIFRRMIENEMRAGRMSKGRRRKLIQFGSHLGLSPVEVGELIARCRMEEPGEEPEPDVLPYVPAAQRRLWSARFAMLLGVALLLEFVVLTWLR